ncbi:Fe2+-dependent dioxygenase [Beijerinckia sp. L45]|uniref:Fe2+-dependent dioxygenase n=1 Tax=Beijerinckia sp. L45 TaxID=1641855 RepID=UPI00131B5A52|nr:Fe2+-dependent dioxygenase [Beijerinckia sp. L45]
MIVHIPNVLTKAEVAHCRSVMEPADWVDGNVTSGHQAKKAKKNLQLLEGVPAQRELADIVLQALNKNNLFFSAALPHTICPPLFNRYNAGMTFGTHVDNAVRRSAGGLRIRTDISATLFLSEPEEYEGGELTIEDTYGSHSVKLPAGDLIIYPSDSLHHVTPITEGSRSASFFWVQSLIRDLRQRRLLFDLDGAIIQLTRDMPDNPALVTLMGTYHNLLRLWTEV